ncbi:hypothetical protein X762_30680 [Mesorhizobium sp. LSHC426A00]|nr:hypothetical protein X762_30680 [Mesorhizobium sp. LSHC426A00]
MMLVCGKSANWILHGWVCELRPRFGWFKGLCEWEADVAVYG